MHWLCHAGVFSKHKGTADGGERCSLAMSQKRGNVSVSTMGGRCNESREPALIEERRSLVLHDELVCKPTERGCGLGMVLASCPTEQVMLLMSV